MNRVETALHEGRCVFAIGARALQTPEVQAELRRRTLPVVALGSEAINPAVALSASALGPALDKAGGLLVLVEPEGSTDGKALAELERLVKAGAHKPRLVVAARAFNPFGLPMALRLLKLEQEKQRALDFLASLPAAAAVEAPPAPVAPPVIGRGTVLSGRIEGRNEGRNEAKVADAKSAEPSGARAPAATLIGREEELATLRELLGTAGGPIVLVGPLGSGRRWLVESALDGAEADRLPDFQFGRGAGFDMLMARFALLTKEAGDGRLHDALRAADRPTPGALVALALDALNNSALASKVMVLHGLDCLLDRRDGSFYRNGRLEMLLRALLQATPALRFVFCSDLAPTFYREGEGLSMRILNLAGIKGRELHALYAAWYAAEFPRDRFGPISDRTFGHPMTNRFLALATRQPEADVDKLLEQPKFLKSASFGDLEALRRHIKRVVEKLDDATRGALLTVALPRIPVDAATLQMLGIGRNIRIDLQARGLLDQLPSNTGGERLYYVHPLIQEQLSNRDVEDFDRMAGLAEFWQNKSKELKTKGKLLESLALAQESNRLCVEARRARARLNLPYPDADALVDDLRSLIRRKKNPRPDIARARLNELLKGEKGNTELLLCDAELKVIEGAPNEEAAAAFARAAEFPTGEVFHTEAGWHQSRTARARAAQALEKGVATFPEDARMRRRLAGFQIGLNSLLDAVETLKAAQAIEPMMPDTYGMLGEVYARLGTNHWEAAEQNIEEALRLAPEGAQHLARRAELLRLRAMVEADQRDNHLARAEELLRHALQIEAGNGRIQVLLAGVILDRDGDLEQAEWLLKEAHRGRPNEKKRRESPEAAIQRARILFKRNLHGDAEKLLAKVEKAEPHNHVAIAVQAEVLQGLGQIGMAFQKLRVAHDRCPQFAPERAVYETRLLELATLVQAGIVTITPPQAEQAPVRPAGEGRRGGAQMLRRRKDGTTVEVNPPAASASGEEAPVGAAEEAGEEVGEEVGNDELELDADAHWGEEAGAEDLSEDVGGDEEVSI